MELHAQAEGEGLVMLARCREQQREEVVRELPERHPALGHPALLALHTLEEEEEAPQ